MLSQSCGEDMTTKLISAPTRGHFLAIVLIEINLFSNLVNTILGTEPRAIVGVPIALLL